MKLITLPPAFGMRNVSPFCLKAEMALAHLKLDHKIDWEKDPRKTPKGKLPVLHDGSLVIADSELILKHLDETTKGGLYGKLTPEQNAIGTSATRLAEEHLYWFIVASRWLDDDWWPNVVSGFFGFVPALFRGFAANGARKEVAKTLHLQGLGRHNTDEQLGFARRDLQALQDLVGDTPFLFGSEACVHDFAVASILAGAIDNKPATWMTTMVGEYPALVEYTERVQNAVGVWGIEKG